MINFKYVSNYAVVEGDTVKKLLIGIVLLIFLAGCNSVPDDLSYFNGISTAKIPQKCLEYKDDVCGLFACTVDMCWCDDSTYKKIVYKSEGVSIQNKSEAIMYVEKFLDATIEGDVKYLEAKKMTRAVKLNNIFYNVFGKDSTGNEIVYTLAVDGTIFRTVCGV